MSSFTTPVRVSDFSGDPLPQSKVDAGDLDVEFDNSFNAFDEIKTRLDLLTRSDDTLHDELITMRMLHPEVISRISSNAGAGDELSSYINTLFVDHYGTNPSGEIGCLVYLTSTATLNQNESTSAFAVRTFPQPVGKSVGTAPIYYTGIGSEVDILATTDNNLEWATIYGNKSIINYHNAAMSGTSLNYMIGAEVELIIQMEQLSGGVNTIYTVNGLQISPGPFGTLNAGATTYITEYRALDVLPVAFNGAGDFFITQHWNLHVPDTAGGSHWGSSIMCIGNKTPILGAIHHTGIAGFRTEQTILSDAMMLVGNGLGNLSLTCAITSKQLTGNRVFQLPDADINITATVPTALTLAGNTINLSGTNTGDLTVFPVDNNPNANGCSIAPGQQFALQPASVLFPGVVTTGAQSIAGFKTFGTGILIGNDFVSSDKLKVGGNSTFDGSISITNSNDIFLGTGNGTKIATATNQKLGFWNTTPVVQPNTTGTALGFTANAGTAVNDASTFTGNAGGTAYRISDIVRALKQIGLLQA